MFSGKYLSVMFLEEHSEETCYINQTREKPIFAIARSELIIVAEKASLLWGFLPPIFFGNSIVNVQIASSNS